MIVIEGLIIVGSIAGSILLHNGLKRLGVIVSKKKLKKLLIKGFTILDFDVIKKAITGLKDFDYKHNTKKLDKYLLPIIKEFKDSDEKMSINEKNLKVAIGDFSQFHTIFDEDEEEVSEQNAIVDEKLDLVNEQLQEVKRRRDEVMQRKNHIKAIQRQEKKRMSGGMG